MHRRVMLFSVILLTILSSSRQADTTQILAKTPMEMGSESSLIALGKVDDVRCYWNNSRTKIFTETTVNVSDSFKGNPGGQVRIVQLGGVVGNIKMTVHGTLKWEKGEEVLLFLERYDGTRYRVSGFSQGKFKVERDRTTGIPFVMAPSGNQSGLLRLEDSDGGRERVPLNKFINRALATPQN